MDQWLDFGAGFLYQRSLGLCIDFGTTLGKGRGNSLAHIVCRSLCGWLVVELIS